MQKEVCFLELHIQNISFLISVGYAGLSKNKVFSSLFHRAYVQFHNNSGDSSLANMLQVKI